MESLTPEEVRVLGSLVEKEKTTPDSYPLSLNALTAACNQKSNRNPVVAYDEKTVVRALDGLREKKLVWMRSRTSGRVPNYQHGLEEALRLRPAELALLCTLMLRGPQTIGELRSHSARIQTFDSLDRVASVLDDLMTRQEKPLAAKLPRRPGQKEARYTHLLAGEPDVEAEPYETPAEPARQAVQQEDQRLAQLEQTVDDLRNQLAELQQAFERFRSEFE